MIAFVFSLTILIITLGAQIYLRFVKGMHMIEQGEEKTHESRVAQEERIKKVFKLFFVAAILGVAIVLVIISWQQYQVWEEGSMTKFLLEQPVGLQEFLGNIPFKNVNYFTFYVAMRFYADYIVSLIFALLFLWAAIRYNKKYQERFFYGEEPYLGAMGIFLSSHPGWLFYFIGFVVLYLAIHIVVATVRGVQCIIHARKNERKITSYQLPVTSYRVPLYWLWIPSAIFAILIQNIFLAELPLWRLLLI